MTDNQKGNTSKTVDDGRMAAQAAHDDVKVNAPHMHKDADVKAHNASGHAKNPSPQTMKIGFVADIEKETKKNTDFRRVLYTAEKSQFVLMCLQPMEDIGMETHNDIDQFFRFEEGHGTVVINGKEHAVKDGSGVIVPCGSKHNVLNTSKTDVLRLYTIYSPPNHLDKVVRKTKQDALATEEHFDGKTTE